MPSSTYLRAESSTPHSLTFHEAQRRNHRKPYSPPSISLVSCCWARISLTRVHFARVDDDGKLHLQSPEVFKQAVRAYAGKFVELTVREQRNRRSGRQLRWYWGQILELLSEHTGYTPDELHDYCKSRFIPKRLAICDGNGVVIDERVIGGSTGKLKAGEMADYCESIRQWAAEELGVVIPDPDPTWRSRGED